MYRRLGGPQGRSGQVRKISPPPGFDPRTVQPVGSRKQINVWSDIGLLVVVVVVVVVIAAVLLIVVVVVVVVVLVVVVVAK